MKSIGPRTTREQLAATVSEALRAAGLDAVLVGGSVVSIYTQDFFPSDDLDYSVWRNDSVKDVLRQLGFTRVEGNRLTHPTAPYYVQLVNGPPMVGKKLVSKAVERKTRWGRIKMYSPLDCVLDRLAHFFCWGDRQCLQQAAHVAAEHAVDLAAVEEWAENEDGAHGRNMERFREFVRRVEELLAGRQPGSG